MEMKFEHMASDGAVERPHGDGESRVSFRNDGWLCRFKSPL